MKNTHIINKTVYALFIALLIVFIPACQKDEGTSARSFRTVALFSSLKINVEQSLGANFNSRVLESLQIIIDKDTVTASFSDAREDDLKDHRDKLYQFYRYYELEEDSLLSALIGVSILVDKETEKLEEAFVQITAFDSIYSSNPGVLYTLQADGLKSLDYSLKDFTFDFDYDGRGTGKYRGPEEGRVLFPPAIDIALSVEATK